MVPAILANYGTGELAWIGIAIFLMGMSKGGFPIGVVTLPILILAWPQQATAAREVVAFMLPLLCVMDVVALLFYRRHIRWQRIVPLLPGTLAGIAIGTVLFVSDDQSLVALSDRGLKICIGCLGLGFVLHRAARKWVLRRLDKAQRPTMATSTGVGTAAGVTSTMAHGAGPILQMYLLPQHLPKMDYVGTNAAYFFLLNLVKVLPFALLGRIKTDALVVGAAMLPVIPIGVLGGYLLVRALRGHHYVAFIYSILFVTSVLLLWKAFAG